MEYGVWLSKRGKFHTIRECRHHGLSKFYHGVYNGRNRWRCLECNRQTNRGVRTGKIAGCPNTVGLIIAEAVLSKAFKTMIKANSNIPYDFICGHNLKIDSKCSTLSSMNGQKGKIWRFFIRKNKVPDVFCLIALDNLPGVKPEDAKPIHVWLIPGNVLIDGRALNDRMSLGVTPRTISRLDPWRRTDMEGRIIKCCDSLKEGAIS